MTRHPLLLSVAGLAMTALAVALTAGHPTAQLPRLASRFVATEATKYRPLTSVHAGAGNMAFAGLLNRGAIGPHSNFLHRGEIPPGSGAEPLELLVVAVARDMETKTVVMRGVARP